MSTSTNLKLSTLEINGTLSSSGSLNLSSGYTFLGDTKNNKTKNVLPEKSFMTTSEDTGNYSRNLYNINTSGPIQFSNTSDDKKIAILNSLSNVITTPILATYPWLYTGNEQWTSNTEVYLNSNLPVYKCLGKGLGEVVFYKVADSHNGDSSVAGNTIAYLSNGTITGNNSNPIQLNQLLALL
jgi:hypothetical protein